MIDKISGTHGQSIGVKKSDDIQPSAQAEITKEIGINSVGGSLAGAIDHMAALGMPIDMQRVTAVRNAIADGHYPIDPTMVADKMIAFDLAGSDFS